MHLIKTRLAKGVYRFIVETNKSEDTKRVIRSPECKKDRKCNNRKKKDTQ
jgi:hypothetical protein